jgi:hypothetical protein
MKLKNIVLKIVIWLILGVVLAFLLITFPRKQFDAACNCEYNARGLPLIHFVDKTRAPILVNAFSGSTVNLAADIGFAFAGSGLVIILLNRLMKPRSK